MADITHVCRGYFLASDAMVALTILSGSRTGSPRLILSTFSIPSTTLPHAVYWLSRKVASPKQMKNWLSPELGSPARAIDTVPRTWGSLRSEERRVGKEW